MSNDSKKICIVGAGPAGLAAIAQLLEGAKKNPSQQYEEITLIEKRSLVFTRRQKIAINPQKIDREDTNIRWDDFCTQLFDPNHELKLDTQGRLLGANNQPIHNLNKRQKFLRKLMRQSEDPNNRIYKNFSIKDLQNALLEHIRDTQNQVSNITIKLCEKTIITAVDIPNKELILSNNEKISFDTLLLCEGEKRETTNDQVNDALSKEQAQPFTYRPLYDQEKSYHCAVRLALKDPQRSLKTIHSEDHQSQSLQALQELGWDAEELPQYAPDSNITPFMKYDNQPSRVFIASEIPEKIFNIRNKKEQRETIIKWASILASDHYGIPASEFVVNTTGEGTTNQLNATTFVLNIEAVDNPVRIPSQDMQFIVLGDTAISPHYGIGLSSTMALHQAITAIECLTKKGPINFQPLIDQHQVHKNFITSIQVASENEAIRKSPTTRSSLLNPSQITINQAISPFHSLEEYKDYCTLIDTPPRFFIDSNQYDDYFISEYYDRDARKSFVETEHPPAHPKLIILYELLALQYLIEEKEKSNQATESEKKEKDQLLDELKKYKSRTNEYYSKNLEVFGFFKQLNQVAIARVKSTMSELESNPNDVPYQQSIDSRKFKNIDTEISDTISELENKRDDVQYQLSIDLFVEAMIQRFINNDDSVFESNLKQCVSAGMIPAMIELGKYYINNNRMDEAFSCFLNAACRGASAAYIELAAWFAQSKTNTLNLFQAYFLLDQGTKSSTFYLSCEHDDLEAQLDQLEADLKVQLNKSDQNDASHLEIRLDLIMAKEYRRIMQYENNAETNNTLSPEKKLAYQDTLNILKNLSKQYQIALLSPNQLAFIKAMEVMISNALSQCSKKPPTFYEQIMALQNSVIEMKMKKALEQVDASQPRTPTFRR